MQTGLPVPDDLIVYRPKPIARPGLALNVWFVNVLVVEDDAADAELILKILARNADVTATELRSTPEAALRDLAKGLLSPTIVLLDIHMPKLSGFSFVEKFRDIPAMRQVPVVFLTTSRSKRDVEAAKESSACAFLVKPDTYDEFKICLDRVIGQVVAGRRKK